MEPKLLNAIKHFNPGTKYFTFTEGKSFPDKEGFQQLILQRLFWVFGPCVEAFRHCRPVVLVDATFLLGKCKGVLMMAVGVDFEEQLVPLAFCLAESENNDG